MINRTAVVIAVAVGFAASSGYAAPIDPVFHPDGTVRVGSETFPSREAFYRSALFQASGARCGTPEPDFAHIPIGLAADCAQGSTTINPLYDDNRVFVIQTVFHVVKNTAGIGNLTPELVQSQLAILNEDFNAIAGTPGAPGTNVKMQFVLAKFDPMGNPTTGINYVTNNAYFNENVTSNSAMKNALRWDTSRYFNVYTNQPGQTTLGYATFPWNRVMSPDQDGVVLRWSSVGRNAPGGPPYDQGRTATHEVGHWLGLWHTFQGGSGTACPAGGLYVSGDLIADTNRHSQPAFGCTVATDCMPALAVPIENYMNYTDDTCMNKFTPEQSNRMRCALTSYRNVNTVPTAAFTHTAVEKMVTFTNTSTDAESPTMLTYAWTFGDSTTSTEASPVHVYAADGSYNVRLEVVDPGSGIAIATQMVVVTTPPPMPDAGTGGGGGGGGDDDGGGGGGEGGGCCQAPGGDLSFALCAVPVVLVLRRRRRRA